MEINDAIIIAIISAGMSVLVVLINKYFDAPANRANTGKTTAETIASLWSTIDTMKEDMDADRAACYEREARIKHELEEEREARRAADRVVRASSSGRGIAVAARR